MKYTYTITIILCTLCIGTLTSCVNDPKLPYPLEEILDSKGSFVRILTDPKSINSDFNGNDVNGETFSFEYEVYDPENGALSESITFYASYVSTARETSVAEIKIPSKTIDVSSLTSNPETNLPSGTFSISYSELNALFDGQQGFNKDSIHIGDRFKLRWELLLKDEDKTIITNKDMSDQTGDISGFYKSPFAYDIDHTLIIPEDRFVGTYTITQDTQADDKSILSDSTDGWVFGEKKNNTITLKKDGDRTRSFEMALGFKSDSLNTPIDTTKFALEFTPQLSNGGGADNVTLKGEVDTGFICEIGVFHGSAKNDNPDKFNEKGDFDFNNDATFTFVIRENTAEDCGKSANEFTFTAVKQ